MTAPVAASASSARPAGTTGAHEASSHAGQYVTFLCAGVEYGIPILQVQEIKGWGRVTPIPCAPHLLLGVMNLRGAVVPVIDLRRALGLGDCAFEAETAVLLARVDEGDTSRSIGLVVDSVCGVSTVDSTALRPLPAVGVRSSDVAPAGIAVFDDRMALLIDGAQLFDLVSNFDPFCRNRGPSARRTGASTAGHDQGLATA
ncbi:MAG: chemotaxis protein CheW [Proteobacteria bacterium]|nr:chemotaxis protein CheW [Pseudomonadota bacterium]